MDKNIQGSLEKDKRGTFVGSLWSEQTRKAAEPCLITGGLWSDVCVCVCVRVCVWYDVFYVMCVCVCLFGSLIWCVLCEWCDMCVCVCVCLVRWFVWAYTQLHSQKKNRLPHPSNPHHLYRTCRIQRGLEQVCHDLQDGTEPAVPGLLPRLF